MAALVHMAGCEEARQEGSRTGASSKRRRAAPRGFHNYLVSILGLPDWAKDELVSLSKAWRVSGGVFTAAEWA